MTLYNSFKTDPDMEKNGIDLDYGENSKGQPIRFRVARAGGANRKFSTRLAALTKPVRTQINTESLPIEKSDSILREVYADTVILGWQNVEAPVIDENNQPTDEYYDLPFNKANCIKVLTDLPDLFADIKKQAENWTLYRKEQDEADSKN